MVKRFTEGAETADVLATGEGACDSDTGKLARVAGEFTFSLSSYGFSRLGPARGRGGWRGDGSRPRRPAY